MWSRMWSRRTSGIPKKDIEVIRTYLSGYADPNADAVDMTHDLDMLAAANEWLTLGENRAQEAEGSPMPSKGARMLSLNCSCSS